MTELQDICVMIRIEYDNYKITGTAKHYVEELSKLSDILTEEHVALVFQFLCETKYWETKIGIATKERLLNLAKKKLKIPIYPKYKIR